MENDNIDRHSYIFAICDIKCYNHKCSSSQDIYADQRKTKNNYVILGSSALVSNVRNDQ